GPQRDERPPERNRKGKQRRCLHGPEDDDLHDIRKHVNQISRSARATGIRAARIAGSRPPTAPINAEKIKPPAINAGVMRNLNATSLKLEKFVVPVDRPCTGSASTHPTMPPISASATDSARNAVTIRIRENPSARSVPISRVR